jgi:hypothetical protein
MLLLHEVVSGNVIFFYTSISPSSIALQPHRGLNVHICYTSINFSECFQQDVFNKMFSTRCFQQDFSTRCFQQMFSTRCFLVAYLCISLCVRNNLSSSLWTQSALCSAHGLLSVPGLGLPVPTDTTGNATRYTSIGSALLSSCCSCYSSYSSSSCSYFSSSYSYFSSYYYYYYHQYYYCYNYS